MKKFIILLLPAVIFLAAPDAAAANKTQTDKETVYSYVKTDWWSSTFQDFILTNYIIKAVQNNYDLRTASLKVKETIENKNLVRAGEMPSIGIGAVPALYKLPAVSNSSSFISFPLYASYEIDLFGKNRGKTKSMDRLIDISKQNERAAYLSAASALGSTYYNIVKLDKLVEIQENIIKERREIYNLMKLSNDEGLISAADTVSAYKALIKSEADMSEYKKLRAKLLNLLAVLTGGSPENSADYERISYDDLILAKQIPDFIPSEIIENRPDYISAEKMIEKAGLDVKTAKKEFLPSFNIIGLLAFNSAKHLSLNWAGSAALLAGGALLPLFTGGLRTANLKLKKNKYEQALENYKNTNIKAVQEVNDALCSLKLDNEKYLKTLESYEAENKNFYYTGLKYKSGVISKLDYLQKQEALYVTEKMLVQDKTALFVDRIGLYKASAGEI